MNDFTIKLHLIWSVLFLGALKYLHSGRWRSFCHSYAISISAIMIGLVLFVVTLLFHFHIRGFTSVKKIPLLVMIGVLDFFVLVDSTVSLIGCIERKDTREFWGENREIDKSRRIKPLSINDSACSRLESAISACEDLALSASPSAWKPHRCTGRVNPLASGWLFVKIVDPENEYVLGVSKRVEAKWSENPHEVFDFDIPCYMRAGRADKYYAVRCELWFLSYTEERETKLGEAIVMTNGYF